MAIPRHIAIIPDGNGRWAEREGKSIADGHRRGMDVLEEVVVYLFEQGVEYLSVYAFSTENWKRSEEEKKNLFELIQFFFDIKIERLIKSGIKMDFLGNLDVFDSALRSAIDRSMERTRNNGGRCLQIALNYGSRDEIRQAVEQIAVDYKEGKIEKIDENTLGHYLYTKGIPDPDIVVRTGNVYRLSNFLLYQVSYSELYFEKKFWPDMNKEDFKRILEDFSQRSRRFGGRSAS